MNFLIEQVADQYDQIEKSIKYDDPFRKYIFIFLAVLIISLTLSIVALVKQWMDFAWVFAVLSLLFGVAICVVGSKNDKRFFMNEDNLKKSLYGCKQLYINVNDNQFFRLSLCNSANGGKAWIYGLSRHLSFREILGISLSVLA